MPKSNGTLSYIFCLFYALNDGVVYGIISIPRHLSSLFRTLLCNKKKYIKYKQNNINFWEHKRRNSYIKLTSKRLTRQYLCNMNAEV